MLRPVLDIQSTAKELARLCQLLTQAKTDCSDSNLVWKIAQLLSMAEELSEQFVDEFSLWHLSHDDEDFNAKLFNDDRMEAGLSLAFHSAAVLDAAVYKQYTPSAVFMNSVKFLRRNILELLHEKREWR